MSNVAFDTLAFTETLKAAGVSDIHGLKEEIIKLDTRVDALDARIDTVARELDAKIDTATRELDARLSAKISDVETGLSAKIDDVDARLSAKINLVHWMMGFNLVLTSGIFFVLLQGG